MASFDSANAVDVSDAANFIPEIWSNEVLAAYKKNLVMAALVTMLNHRGRKGDTIHIPKPDRDDASAKAAATPVSLIAHTESEVTVTLDQHFHYARLIEDITEVQALASLRQFFTDDAGYALSKQVDTSLVNLAATWGGGTSYSTAVIGSDGATVWDGSANTNTGNGTAISDAGIRRVIQDFDDGDVPGRGRYLAIPPVEKRKLLGETRFTEQAFVGEAGQGNSIRNGLIGDLYGTEIYVSTNLATVQADDSSTNYRAALMFQKEALVLAEQLSPRVQQQYKLEHLGSLMVSDTIYGVQTVRGGIAGENGQGARAIIVPA